MPKHTKPSRILPDGTVEIQLSKGYVAIIDAIDADLAIYNWSVSVISNGKGYARRSLNGCKPATEHLNRVVLERVLGRQLATNEIADHIDRNPLNNTRSNIRLATSLHNARNKSLPSNSSSGFKGVSFEKGRRSWSCAISVDKRLKRLGHYLTAEEAAIVYNHFAKHFFGEFAALNPIPDWEKRYKDIRPIKLERKLSKNNTSGFRGVSWDGHSWTASVTINYKSIHIGSYDTTEEAHRARMKYIEENNVSI